MYRVVNSFFRDRKAANKKLTEVKKKWDSAKVVQCEDGAYAVTFLETDDHKKALEVLHKVFAKGLFCGIETVNQ